MLFYATYLAAVSLGLLELSLRMGVPTSAIYEERQQVYRQLTDRPRVLVLGDSFSLEGEGSLGALLKRHFAARGIDTINLARMGEGPSFYLDRLKLYGGVVRPRLILVNYFAGNDLTDTANELDGRGRARRIVKQLMARSFSANQLIGLVHRMSLRRRIARIEASPDYGKPGVEKLTNPFMFEIRAAHPDFLVQNLLMPSAEAERAWQANQGYLLEIKRLAAGLDAELAIAILPPDVQVQKTHYRFYQTLGIQTDPRFLETDTPQRRFARFCGENQLRCFDLLPALRRAGSRELYLEQDTHWNAEGNRLAFEAIARQLDSNPWSSRELAARRDR